MAYNTRQRKILIDFFNNNPDLVFTAEEISEKLVNENISLSAVYRNLSQLERLKKIRKVSKNGTRKSFYQFVDCTHCKNHLHLLCTKCGKSLHLDDNETNLLIENVLSTANFSIDKNATILYGLCKLCLNK